MNPSVSVYKSETTSLNEGRETRVCKDVGNSIKQDGKGLHVESVNNSDESEPGSPEIWTPPSILQKGSSESSNQVETYTEKVDIKQKTNEYQIEENALTDLSQQQDDSKGKEYNKI